MMSYCVTVFVTTCKTFYPCVPVYLHRQSAHLFIFLPVGVMTCQSICPCKSVCLSPSKYLSASLIVSLSFHLNLNACHQYICLSDYLSVFGCQSVSLYPSVPVYLSNYKPCQSNCKTVRLSIYICLPAL